MPFFATNFGYPSLLPRRRHFWLVPLSKRFEHFCTFQQCCFFFAWVILEVLKCNIVSLIVKTIFVCVDEAIVAKTNKSVETVYNLRMINTIWTFTFESFVIRSIFFLVSYFNGLLYFAVKRFTVSVRFLDDCKQKKTLQIIIFTGYSVHSSALGFHLYLNFWETETGETLETSIVLENKEDKWAVAVNDKKVVLLDI